MNRNSLLAKFASARAPQSSRLDFFRVHLEPLEERQLLTTTPVYVNDNWVNLSNPGIAPAFGDLVTNSLDTIDTGNVLVLYGIAGFGSTVDGTGAGFGLINNAIQGNDTNGTVNILEGTYRESDIVIDRPMLVTGAGQTGPARTLIVPEVTSGRGEANFAVGSHQGIILYSNSVTVQNLALDGSGNGSLGGSLHYHHGITTMYDLQNGGSYSSLHNGTLAPNNFGASGSTAAIRLEDLTVTNTWYHGITVSGTASNTTRVVMIDGVSVSNVGEVAQRNTTRIGIQLQNLDTGTVLNSTVAETGVGIASGILGTGTFGNNTNARNKTGLRLNTVTNAVARAYSIEFQDTQIDLNFILDPNSYFIGFDANFANYTGLAGANATGIYVNHSQPILAGFSSNGAYIGIHVQNTTYDDLLLPIMTALTLTGPGSAVPGSVGILAENSALHPDTASFAIADASTITGFQTGIRLNQTVAAPLNARNQAEIDRVDLSGNATAISVQNGSELHGGYSTTLPVSVTGTGRVVPTFIENPFVATDLDPLTLAPENASVMNTGNISFGSSSTYAPTFTGETGTTQLFNFNGVADYIFGLVPPAPEDGQTGIPYGTSLAEGQVVQNGNGQLVIGNGAANGPITVVYGTNNHLHPDQANFPDIYVLDPVNLVGRTNFNIVAKKGADNQSTVFLAGLVDIYGAVSLWPFSYSELNTSTYSTLSVNLLAPGIPFSLGDTDNFDLSQVIGYAILGDIGLVNGNANVPFSLTVDNMAASSVFNGQLNVTGTVNLGGANLDASVRAPYDPTLTQQFTIINNDGVDAITGTFAGVAQNSYVTVSGNTYKVNYSGGTGNDVVLTRENFTPTNSSVVGRHLFYNQSGTPSPLRYDGNNLAINANDDLAIATNKSAYLPGSGAATFANVSSYTKGINGIMIDIAGTHGTITAADFIFRVGNNNTPNSWVAAPAPNSISVRAGAGVSGSDRVVLTWANGAITKKWLEVIVLANANTNLAQKVGYPVGQGDVFFFGNAVANSGSGDNATQAIVNVTDELGARNNPAGVLTNIPVTNLFDYNRDGAVNTTDALAARNNPTNTGNVVRYISIANPPAAPEASPASDDGAVASALSTASVGGALSSAGVPRWLVNRLQNVDLDSGPIARFFEHLADQNTPGTRTILVAADKVADELGLEHDLLESLLADLGL